MAKGIGHVIAEVIYDPVRFIKQLLEQVPKPQEWLSNHMKPQLGCLLSAGVCSRQVADCLRMILPDRDQFPMGKFPTLQKAATFGFGCGHPRFLQRQRPNYETGASREFQKAPIV
jgi:hypothetical protein